MTSDPLAARIADLGNDQDVQAILADVCRITGMRFAAVAYVSEQRWIACQVDDRIEFGLDPGGELEIGKTICDDIRRDGKPILIDDTDNDPDWWSHPVPILYGFHSYLSLPITLDDGAFFGTLCAIDPEPRAEPIVEHLDTLQALAKRVAAILGPRIDRTSNDIPLGCAGPLRD